MTEHADHFLSRLDRLDREELELALLLYNHVDLAREILLRLRIPADVERAAVALRDGGPYIVFAHDGGFVTCLGKGMTTGYLHVVPAERFHAVAEHVAELTARRERAREEGGVNAREAFYQRPRGVTREDIRSLEPFAGMLRDSALDAIAALITKVDHFAPWARRNRKKLGGDRERIGSVVAQVGWAAAQETVLLALGDALPGYRSVDQFSTEEGGVHLVHIVRAGARIPWVPFMARMIWSFARLAPVIWKGLRRKFLQADGVEPLWYGAAIAAAGLRHRDLRGEAQKLLKQHRYMSRPPAPSFGLVLADLVDVIDRADAFRRAGAEFARSVAADFFQRCLPEGHPLRPATEADVPDDILVAFLANAEAAALDDPGFRMLFVSLPAIATAKAEDLYLPKAYAEAMGLNAPLGGAYGELLFDAWGKELGGKQRPVVGGEEVPGRNAPCSCGSGKKWKRCCGG